MRMQLVLDLTLLGFVLMACAGPPPPRPPPSAVEPSPVASASATAPLPSVMPAPAAAPAGGEEPQLVPPPAAASSSTAAPSSAPAAEERPSRSPIDVLTAPDTAFVINYTGSEPIDTARKVCAGKAAEDSDALAQCLSEARGSFRADVIRFRPSGGHWTCTIYRREGSRLDELYSARVDLSEESPNRVKLKFSGAEKGVRPVLKNRREIVIEVPNDYSLAIQDSEVGRLLYDAKIGLVGR